MGIIGLILFFIGSGMWILEKVAGDGFAIKPAKILTCGGVILMIVDVIIS